MQEILDTLVGVVRPIGIEMIGLVVAASLTWAAKRFRDWTGIEIEARHREALQSALTNAAVLAAARGSTVAVGYVLASVPDAVRHFRLDEGKLLDLLAPKLRALGDGLPRSDP